jgi:chromosome segregation ATPase
MDEQVIKELLEQLKQNLKKIETAREQVEKTVNAYEVLKEDVRHYTEELSFIVQNTRTMISQLEEIKEKFIGNISITIIEEIKAAVRIITEQTNALSSQISSVYDLVDSKSHSIISNINSRSDSIDSALGTIQNTINSLSGKTDSVIEKLDTLTSNEDKHFKEIEKKFDAQEKFFYRELSIVRKQNIILFSINATLLLAILGFVLHLVGLV